mmetsp:Transcript_36838/g.88641  ORF Transcript_36838/g.88641 Transcript_36838/m.88641 type:complete len:90 (-) Transcript_36838:674-943(-)
MALQDPIFHRLQHVLLVSESSKPANIFCTDTLGFALTGLSRNKDADPSPSEEDASPAEVSKSDPAQRNRNQASSLATFLREAVGRAFAN